MSPRSTLPGCLKFVAGVSMVLVAEATAGSAPRPVALSMWNAGAVQRARAHAATKLQRPECQKILSDFTDAEGSTLQENLAKSGLSASDYLMALPFLDGSANRSCMQSWVILLATPGRPSVYVCPSSGGRSRLADMQLQNPRLAESAVIHEMLHTLGLGENPPSSLEITSRVDRRCWR